MSNNINRPPKTDAEWSHNTERRLRELENSNTARVGEWVISSQDGALTASKPGETVDIGQVPDVTVVSDVTRGFVTDSINTAVSDLPTESDIVTIVDGAVTVIVDEAVTESATYTDTSIFETKNSIVDSINPNGGDANVIPEIRDYLSGKWDDLVTVTEVASDATEVADTRVRAGNNLVSNPGFEKPSTLFSMGDGVRDALIKRTGTHSARMTATGAIQNLTLIANASGPVFMTCTPGDIFYIEAWVYGKSTNAQLSNGANGIRFYLDVRTATDAEYTPVYSTGPTASNAFNAQWTRFFGYITIPTSYSSAAQFTAGIRLGANVLSGDVYYFDDPIIRVDSLVNGWNYIFDGANGTVGSTGKGPADLYNPLSNVRDGIGQAAGSAAGSASSASSAAGSASLAAGSASSAAGSASTAAGSASTASTAATNSASSASTASTAATNSAASASTASGLAGAAQLAVQGVIDGIVNGLQNLAAAGTGALVAEASAAARATALSISNLSIITANLQAAKEAGMFYGTAINETFSSYSVGALSQSTGTPAATRWTATVVGTGSAVWQITQGVWLSNAATMTPYVASFRTSRARYNTTTVTRYQKVGVVLAGLGGYTQSGGRLSENIGDQYTYIYGRMNAAATRYVFARIGKNEICIGYNTGSGDVPFPSSVKSYSAKAGATYWLECGTGSLAQYSYKMYENSTAITSAVDSSAVSPNSPTDSLYAGFGGYMQSANFGPASIAGFALYDNVPPTYRGSGFRASNSTASANFNVAIGSGLSFPANWFLGEYCTDDMLYAPSTNTITISQPGWYHVAIRQKGAYANQAFGTYSGRVAPVVLLDSGAGTFPIEQIGTDTAVSSLTQSFGGTFVIYCEGGDKIRPAYSSTWATSGAATYTGSTLGKDTYFTVTFLHNQITKITA